MAEASEAALTVAQRRMRRGLFVVALFSAVINVLMFTGPLYMLQIYSRVLGSGSVETLVAMSLLAIFLYASMGLLDTYRARALARIGGQLQTKLDPIAFRGALDPDDPLLKGQACGPEALSSVTRGLSSSAAAAIFDIPWSPFFLFVIVLLHPWLGIFATVGGGVLVLIALAQRLTTGAREQAFTNSMQRSQRMELQAKSERETIFALGMQGSITNRWGRARDTGLENHVALADRVGGFTATARAMRLLLQSAMLGLGAYLAIRGELSPGAMIAGSILLGRALAPIETVIGQWRALSVALVAWKSLKETIANRPPAPDVLALRHPEARLEAQNITVLPPGQAEPTLRGVSFDVGPGQALGVIGPSGAGKTTLARAMIGLWPARLGDIRLGGARLDRYEEVRLGRLLGYLPQRVALFDGTVAENIARMDENPDPEAVLKAAQAAGVHHMILQFPQGYETPITAPGTPLSGGQVQRVGLARALYGDPVLLVLDEPDAHLDHPGGQALKNAIRSVKERDGAAIIMAHRPAAISECDLLLMLDNGQRVAFGPREEVLKARVANYVNLKAVPKFGESVAP
ncbi:type I secretion system permease/ATPase [Roseivivax sp. GX 12232]|uniref:type I secretion system permease/ATPase n=1 Tax=Roseivivax sp. GX 12232 TaxID=2900547 RepID=UPI001E4EA2C5|nr:type I secretion system permease/ATPase [Roseivivax sp. GX 12232]MCE0506912.1 type I secretion system permease/ATPase [Roseivivax sp. GX 12232]